MKFYLSILLLLIRDPRRAFQQIIAYKPYKIVIVLFANFVATMMEIIAFTEHSSVKNTLIVYGVAVVLWIIGLTVIKLFVWYASFADIFLMFLWTDVFRELGECLQTSLRILGRDGTLRFTSIIWWLIGLYSLYLLMIGIQELRRAKIA